MGRNIDHPPDGKPCHVVVNPKGQPSDGTEMVAFAAYGHVNTGRATIAVLKDSNQNVVPCDTFYLHRGMTWVAVFDRVRTPKGPVDSSFTVELWDVDSMTVIDACTFRMDKTHRTKARQGEQGAWNGIYISSPPPGTDSTHPTIVGQDFSAYGSTQGTNPVTGSVTADAPDGSGAQVTGGGGQTIYQSQTSGTFCIQFTGVTACQQGGPYYDVKVTDGQQSPAWNRYINVQ
jgi:hypothetical protein